MNSIIFRPYFILILSLSGFFFFAESCSLKKDTIASSGVGTTFGHWGNLRPGKYMAGYKDTVLFKQDEIFTYRNFKSNKPFFVSIWYPARENARAPFMTIEDYLKYPKQEKYATLYDSMIISFHQIIIEYGVNINIGEGREKPVYDEEKMKLFSDVLGTTVRAKRNLTTVPGKLPCILYHHGAQSVPFDNNVFCEFMASHGYIVISSTYNLPDERVGGLTVSTDERFNDITDIEFMANFVRQVPSVDKTRMVAVGHSWGAQALLRHDNTQTVKYFKGIVSLHTTLEDKPLDYAKESWPEFQYIYENQCEKSTTPVTLFAPLSRVTREKIDTLPNGEETTTIVTRFFRKPEFNAFRLYKTTPYLFTTINHPVFHDGFIALGNIRFPYCEKYKLNDIAEIRSQQLKYEEIVNFSKRTIDSFMKSNTFPSIEDKTEIFLYEFYNYPKPPISSKPD
jgi:hypothetical protein